MLDRTSARSEAYSSGGTEENPSDAWPEKRVLSSTTARTWRPSRERDAGSGGSLSYAARIRATLGSALSGASARATSSRKARSVAFKEGLPNIRSKETGCPGS